jgi:hypothetical protein
MSREDTASNQLFSEETTIDEISISLLHEK